MKTLITRTATYFFAISFALMLGACNTVKGMGQDIQKAGEKIEGVAKK